jgi:hypothetical protein
VDVVSVESATVQPIDDTAVDSVAFQPTVVHQPDETEVFATNSLGQYDVTTNTSLGHHGVARTSLGHHCVASISLQGLDSHVEASTSLCPHNMANISMAMDHLDETSTSPESQVPASKSNVNVLLLCRGSCYLP